MKKILLETGRRKVIIETLGTTYQTIRTALNGSCDSLLSRKIRRLALELGGEYDEIEEQQN